MNILLTGATGFIGNALVRRLMSDHVVYCLTRRSRGLPAHQHVKGIEQDLSEPIETERLPPSMDAIIHLAQSRHFRKFPEQARDMFQVNTDSTFQLLEYGRQAKIRVFVYASSGGVCGYQPNPIRESDPPQLMNFYLASKFAGECLVRSYSDFFKTVNLRYFFAYGEGQRDMFMPGLVGRILQGAPVTLSGETGVAMNPIHVSDAAEATGRALDSECSDTFNIAGDETTNIYELAKLIGELCGREPVFQRENDKGPMAMIANIEKMKLKLGVSPKIQLREGLSRLIEDLRREGCTSR